MLQQSLVTLTPSPSQDVHSTTSETRTTLSKIGRVRLSYGSCSGLCYISRSLLFERVFLFHLKVKYPKWKTYAQKLVSLTDATMSVMFKDLERWSNAEVDLRSNLGTIWGIAAVTNISLSPRVIRKFILGGGCQSCGIRQICHKQCLGKNWLRVCSKCASGTLDSHLHIMQSGYWREICL